MDQHVLLLDKGHFHINLRKLRLAVGSEVLVAEAARHLIILVYAAYHKELFVDLRGLRKRIE